MRHQAADEDRRGQFQRQIDAHGDGQYRGAPGGPAGLESLVRDDDGRPDQRPHANHAPRQSGAEHALRHRRHQRRLGRQQRVGLFRGGRANTVSLQQQVQYGRHHQNGGYHPHALHELLPPGRRSDEVAGLQVLQVVPRDGGAAAHHRADHDRCGGAVAGVAAHYPDQQERGEENGGDGDARYRVVGRSHQSRHVGRHRREQEARDHHDQGHRQRHADRIDDDLVEQEDRDDERDHAPDDQLHGGVVLAVVVAGVGSFGARPKPAADAGKQ